MVTQLQPDVRAYLHGGEVIKRYITDERLELSDEVIMKLNSFTWSNIKRNILHDMGRTATTGEFKDDSFKIKLTTSDKVSKYSVFFKDKKFELGKLTFNFSRETYSIPEKLVKFFNVTKTTDNTMNFLKNVDGLYDFYTESDKSFGGSIKALKNVTGIGKNSKAFSIFDKYGTKTVKTIEDVVGLIGG